MSLTALSLAVAAQSVTQTTPAVTVKQIRSVPGLKITSVAAGSGAQIAVGLESSQVRLIDLDNKRPTRNLVAHDQWVYGLAFSPDGRTLLTGDERAKIIAWNVTNGQQIREFPRTRGHQRGIQSLRFRPDGQQFMSVGKDDVICIWNLSGGNPVGRILGEGANVYDGVMLKTGAIWTATLAEGARLYDPNRIKIATLTLPGGQGAASMVLNPGGTLVATGGRDGQVTLWDVRIRQRIASLKAHEYGVQVMAMSPNGRLIATSSNDRRVVVWDVARRAKLAEFENMSSNGSPLAFTRDGKFLVAANVNDELTTFSITPPQVAAATPSSQPTRRRRR